MGSEQGINVPKEDTPKDIQEVPFFPNPEQGLSPNDTLNENMTSQINENVLGSQTESLPVQDEVESKAQSSKVSSKYRKHQKTSREQGSSVVPEQAVDVDFEVSEGKGLPSTIPNVPHEISQQEP